VARRCVGAFVYAVRQCLAKDPAARWQSAGDVKLALEWVAASPSAPPPRRSLPWIFLAAGLALAATGLSLLWRGTPLDNRAVIRLAVDPGPDAIAGLYTTAILSPDGARLAFLTQGSDGIRRLATRLLDQPRSVTLLGSENADNPFFSPNGEWIGFFADGALKKIPAGGGAPAPQRRKF
jgi:serine/threonine-protein kinase